MSKNDDRILVLRDKIFTQKEQLSKNNKRFSPITNCILDFRGAKYNLNTLNYDLCVNLLVELNALNMSAKDLGVMTSYGGYTLSEWIIDIKNKMAMLDSKKKESELKAMEVQLERLLSEDKKTELEIDKIAELLGE